MSPAGRRRAADCFRALDDESTVDADAWPIRRRPAIAVGVTLAGRYELRSALSRGHMGQVWRALDTQTGAEVAAKLLPRAAAESTGRFAREAAIMRELPSERFVTVLDSGTTESLAYFVMELLEGEDLASCLDREGRLGPDALLPLVDAVSAGLAEAHAAGVVHRDITPKNIFLEATASGRRVRVLDFGLAKHASIHARVTKSGMLLGTPHYMSPEQVEGPHRVDYRTDIWSLAAVAYRALCGRRPFEADSLSELLGYIAKAQPVPPSLLGLGLRPEVDAVFERALAKDRRARPPDAPAFASALGRALRG